MGRILVQLSSIERREFALTPKQLERLISEVGEERANTRDSAQFEEIDDVLRRIKMRMLEEGVAEAQ